jgi:hypothetical protein
MANFEFKGSDGEIYNFKISSLQDQIVPTVQFERLKQIAKTHKTYLQGDEDDQTEGLFEFTDIFWDFLFHDFSKAYPEYWMLKDKEAFHPIKGLTNRGRVWFAEFVNQNNNLVEVIGNVFNATQPAVITDGNTRPDSLEAIESGNTETVGDSDKQRPVKSSKAKSTD